MKATILLNVSLGSSIGRGMTMTEEANTPEECLIKLSARLENLLLYFTTLIFNKDGIIFAADKNGSVPIGVLYQQGYR